MRPRASTLIHARSGVCIRTPLLIPSFSSWAFHGSEYESNTAQWLAYASEFIKEVCLLSAFDIQNGAIPQPSDLPIKPQLIVLDSGGYEASRLILPTSTPAEANTIWSLEKLVSVLAAWPENVPAIFVSYDHPRQRRMLHVQIANARKIQADFPDHLHCFLIKPEPNSNNGRLERAVSSAINLASHLVGFDVIGITDKGLGESPLERMTYIARLRRALDAAGCNAPIHVFGSLDPLSVCIYYLAGAEIFDGLTWLRYSFTRSFCFYHRGHEPLINGLHVKDESNQLQMVKSNYHRISKLQNSLRKFAVTEDFALLPHTKFLREAVEYLDSKL